MYQDFFVSLDNNLKNDMSLSKIMYSDIHNENLNDYNVIVSVGYRAATSIAKQETNSQIVYSLIPDNETVAREITCKENNCYKIYINQPVNRYVKLFKILFPQGKKLVFAETTGNSKIKQQVKTAAKKNKITYKGIVLNDTQNISRIFINELNDNDVLLALPDSDIYNANNAKSIILSTYHTNVPIISYSKSFVRAGALIGLYSSIDNISEMTANIIDSILTNEVVKQKEYYPDDFSIEVNSAVARSLNINIDKESFIKRKLK